MNKKKCYFCNDDKLFLHTNDNPSDKEYNGWIICFPCHNYIYHGKPSSSLVVRRTIVYYERLTCKLCNTIKNKMFYSLKVCVDCGDNSYSNKAYEDKEEYENDLSERSLILAASNGWKNEKPPFPCSIKRFVEKYYESIPE